MTSREMNDESMNRQIERYHTVFVLPGYTRRTEPLISTRLFHTFVHLHSFFFWGLKCYLRLQLHLLIQVSALFPSLRACIAAKIEKRVTGTP